VSGIFVPDPILSAGQIVGTPTNDSALPGNIGEYFSATLAQGSSINLSNSVAVNIGSLPLTPGEWDAFLLANFQGGATTTVTTVRIGMGTVSATVPAVTAGLPGVGTFVGNGATTFSGGLTLCIQTGPQRFQLSAPTTIFGCVVASFGVSTMTAFGTVWARRVR